MCTIAVHESRSGGNMLNIAIVGTGWISRQFADAVEATGAFAWTELFSRKSSKGEQFLNPGEHVTVRTSFAELCDSDQVDVIYIASPNSAHFSQASEAIRHDKHIIVEKPAFSNPVEFRKILELLKKHPSVRMFEAARNIHTKNFHAIAKKLSEMDSVNGATLSYMKYSSKMPMLNDPAQGVPNVFSPDFSGGALQDLGVYLVYDAVALFGKPKEATYIPCMLSTGVDGMGTGVLRYDDFLVTVITSKTVSSSMRSEIYGTKDYISADDGGELRNVCYVNRDGKEEPMGETVSDNPMLGEVGEFSSVLDDLGSPDAESRYQHWLRLSEDVNSVLWDMRRSAGISFPSDSSADLR